MLSSQKEYRIKKLPHPKITIAYSETMKSKNFQSLKNKRIARTRRQRGYNWEDTLVKRFNRLDGWQAFRLGSPSTGLPDVFAISTKYKSVFTIEAKSGTGTSLYVPPDQIERCQKWIRAFDLYENRKVILAFKFLSKKRIGNGEYQKRELREFYKVWHGTTFPSNLVCTYDGETYLTKEGKRSKMLLKEQKMPFNR